MQTHSPQETRALGAWLARQLKPGDVVCLWGDLGAGKSELTRGIAAGLGVTAPVTSPSFTIMNVYTDGTAPLYHFDWYRLESSEELYEMGMDEYLGGDGVAVVEWPGVCPDALPETRLDVTLSPLSESDRAVALTPRGAFRPIKETDDEAAGD